MVPATQQTSANPAPATATAPMCGILFQLSSPSPSTPHPPPHPSLLPLIALRGPDYQGSHAIDLPNAHLAFHAAVLHLRGDALQSQPLVSDVTWDVLLYNGEIWDGVDISLHENDGKVLFDLLQRAESPLEVLSQIEGPYALIYYRSSTRTLYIARDPLGRRSLLLSTPTPSSLLLTSVSSTAAPPCNELDAGAVFFLELDSYTPDSDPLSLLHAHPRDLPQTQINRAFPPPDVHTPDADLPVEQFTAHLRESVRKRVQDVPRLHGQQQGSARIAILFSGGLDCTFLAYLSHLHLPPSEPIDLLNVSFSRTGVTASFDVPDRLTARDSVEELRRVCGGREWRLVEIDVGLEEYEQEKSRIVDLMHPSGTVMDLSLAAPLFFASRGCGTIQTPGGERQAYTSRARVLLSGLGADEALGGYGRHRRTFERGGWEGLIDEIQLDLSRLPTRNLGRDDRVLLSSSREARYPFLSLPFLAFLSSLRIEQKMDLRRKEGEGDKLLLREAARRAGLEGAARRVKRAMQFGTRSSRMDGGGGRRKGQETL